MHNVLLTALTRGTTSDQQAHAVSSAMQAMLSGVLLRIETAFVKHLGKALKNQGKDLRKRLGQGASCGLPDHLIFNILKDFGKISFTQESFQQLQLRSAVNEMDSLRQQLGTLMEPDVVRNSPQICKCMQAYVLTICPDHPKEAAALYGHDTVLGEFLLLICSLPVHPQDTTFMLSELCEVKRYRTF